MPVRGHAPFGTRSDQSTIGRTRHASRLPCPWRTPVGTPLFSRHATVLHVSYQSKVKRSPSSGHLPPRRPFRTRRNTFEFEFENRRSGAPTKRPRCGTRRPGSNHPSESRVRPVVSGPKSIDFAARPNGSVDGSVGRPRRADQRVRPAPQSLLPAHVRRVRRAVLHAGPRQFQLA